MTKEQVIYILSSYKMANKRSQLMLDKIHQMEVDLYSAQAGFVENETGVKVSGGTHISRAEKIASLVDLKEKYASKLSSSEELCYRIMEMIEKIYSKKDKDGEESYSKLLKLQHYEEILIDYYILGSSIYKISVKNGYTPRQTIRVKNAAVESLYNLYKDTIYDSTAIGG